MEQYNIKNEIRNIFSGAGEVRFGAIIQAITRYLNDGAKTSVQTSDSKLIKKQEAERLESYISEKNLCRQIDFSKYVSEGAEQKVYLKDSEHVTKLNDTIYYTSWKDYLQNLLLHNYFFPDTAYNLIGFTKSEYVLYAVVEQAYVAMTSQTDLERVKKFLELNGFQNMRNNDYYSPALGIII